MRVNEMLHLLPHSVRRYVYSKIRPARFSFYQLQRASEFDCFDKLKCIFIHVPKTAGSSVNQALFKRNSVGHYTLNQYKLIFSPADYDAYFKFAFVRNPWDRVYSAYRFLKNGGANEEDRQWAVDFLDAYDDFDQFVLVGLSRPEVLDKFHFHSQVSCLSGPGESWPHIDFLGFFENLEADFLYVAEKLYPGHQLGLPTINRSGAGKSYLQAYTADTKEIVAKIYRKDIDIFGYNFDGSSIERQILHRDRYLKNL